MAGYNGRRAPNFSQYLDDLNAIPSPYDQAVQHLKEQQLQTQRLSTDTAKANKAGVDGSKTVLSAQQTLAQAQLDLRDKTAALQRAEQAQQQAAVTGAQSIARAEQQLSQALSPKALPAAQ